MEGEEENRQQKGGPDQASSMENYLHRRKQHDSAINRQSQGCQGVPTDRSRVRAINLSPRVWRDSL